MLPMYILFSPSEGKVSDASVTQFNTPDPYLFPTLIDKHKDVLALYDHYLKTQDAKALSKLFGIKKEDEIEKYKSMDISTAPLLKAVKRYDGVAYDYLDYNALSNRAQHFIDEHMIIFSNLFGPIPASYPIPNYKLKQGEKLGDFAIEQYYKKNFTAALDDLFKDQFIIDLRAGFYLKFYALQQPHITMKFMKGGKVVSHWAKAYRGKIVQTLAKYQPENEKAFAEIAFENLEIIEILEKKHIKEYVFNIKED